MAVKSSDSLKISHLGEGFWSAKLPVLLITGDYTVKGIDQYDSGLIIFCGTDGKIVTLPKVADVGPGFVVTLINSGADAAAGISLSPNAADAIQGEIANAAADSVASGVANKDWTNTKGTAKTGDFTKLISDGGTDWYIVGGKGIWASQA